MLPVIIEISDRKSDYKAAMAFSSAPIRIGRNPLNDLHLANSFVSQWHALIEFGERNTRYQDLGSTNGTIHEGQRLGRDPVEFLLGESVEVVIGSLVLKISRGPADALLRSTDKSLGKASERLSALTETLDAIVEADAPTDTVLLSPDAPPVVRSIEALGPLYQRYREAWSALATRLDAELAPLTPSLRRVLLERLAAEMPELAHEPGFVAVAGPRGGGPSPRDRAAETALRGLQRFVELYTPHATAPANPDEVRRALLTIVRALEHFTKSFVELRQGQEEFATEMGVATLRHSSPLRTARGPDEVISYLLDWKRHSPQRIKELLATYADIMIHQVALVSGVMEGARALLRRLSPETIAAEVEKEPTWAPRWLRRFSARREWRRYQALHDGLREETALSAALFGREFARAYEAIGGAPPTKAAATVMFQPSLPDKRRP